MYIVVCLDRKLKPSKYVAWYFAGHVFLSPDTRTLHLFDGVDILLAPGTPGDPRGPSSPAGPKPGRK